MTLEAESYLLDIAARVLSARDPDTGNPLVEMILHAEIERGPCGGLRVCARG